VKNLGTDFRNIPMFIYGYQDKFRALPGDDPQRAATSQAHNATAGNGNGVIEGNWTQLIAPPPTNPVLFWQHVRLAGRSGATTDGRRHYQPSNAVGGASASRMALRLPIDRAAPITFARAASGQIRQTIDAQLDDGNTATGTMMRKASHRCRCH
jgi:hypothetical protein